MAPTVATGVLNAARMTQPNLGAVRRPRCVDRRPIFSRLAFAATCALPLALVSSLAPLLHAQLAPIASATQAPESAPAAAATRLATAPVIDGEFATDAAWADVPALTHFRQVEPVSGDPPSAETEVYLGYDDTHLYFAVIAHESAPANLVATQRKRDADLAGDDHVVLVLDPFLDQRNGYYFAFNPLGARLDALVRGGVTLNTDWDGLWSVVAQPTTSGWVAEGAIPLATLAFNPRAPAWGLNVERHFARTGERVRWHGPARQYEVSALANTGRLTGLTDLRRAAGFEVRPFSTLTYLHDRPAGRENVLFKPGLDVFYKLTESTTVVVTLNTDFADAEVDERQVNLTRFPVFFPEKRAFFLQDAGVFAYSLINRNPLPYYSRRIGIGPRGEVVDIVGGARISGREGRVNFGLLGVQTESSGPLEAKQLGVARVLVNATDEIGVGVIGTYGDPRTNGDAWLGGFDLNYNTGRLFGRPASPFQGSLYYEHTDSTGRDGDAAAFGWGAIYDSPTWGVTSYLDRVGEDFYPALGNVSQAGVTTYYLKTDYEFNPAPFKKVVPLVSYNRRQSLVYDAREAENVGPEVLLETPRGDTLLLRTLLQYERLPAPFTVANGVTVRPGEFSGEHYEAALTFSKTRPLAGSASIARKLYYGGTQTLYKSTLTWRPGPIFNLDAAFDYTDVELPYAHFPVRLMKLGGAVQFSPELVWSALAQYDNLSRSVGFNTRVRWTYAPGGDVFFVINQGANVIDDRWDFTRTEISTKIGATWRF